MNSISYHGMQKKSFLQLDRELLSSRFSNLLNDLCILIIQVVRGVPSYPNSLNVLKSNRIPILQSLSRTKKYEEESFRFIEKNRNGPTGDFPVSFQKDHLLFSDRM